jgi:hypothetical protein
VCEQVAVNTLQASWFAQCAQRDAIRLQIAQLRARPSELGDQARAAAASKAYHSLQVIL